MQVLNVIRVRGNILGNTIRPFLRIACGRDALPAIALLSVRLEAPVDLRHHRDVAVRELPRDEFERGAGARHPHRPMVPGVVQPVTLEPKRPEPLPVRLTYGPAVQPTEHALTREHGGEVLPTDWVRVLEHHPEGSKALPGYVWLDMPGKVRHVLERELEFRDD